MNCPARLVRCDTCDTTAAGDVDRPLERRVVKGHAANELIDASRRAV